MSERATRLADDLRVGALTGAARVLAEEAVRIVGRLDRLHAQLSGDADAWLDFHVNLPETVAEVTVDKALAEVRQQGLALASVLKALHSLADGKVGAVPASVLPTADELAARREDRRAAAAAGG